LAQPKARRREAMARWLFMAARASPVVAAMARHHLSSQALDP
jgi:hypothetical protein